MIFNGRKYYEGMGDRRHFGIPKLIVGSTVKLLYSDESTTIPGGGRRMKKGTYVVQNVRRAYSGGDSLVYDLVRNGSKYVHPIFTIPFDKAILDGMIVIV